MVEVLEMLGWQIKKEKGEAPEFAEEFTMLGLRESAASRWHCAGVQQAGERTANQAEG